MHASLAASYQSPRGIASVPQRTAHALRDKHTSLPPSQALDAEFADFWSSSMFVNLDPTRDFTALGSIYLVRTSVLSQVAIFDSAANSYKQLDTLPAPLLPAPALPDTYCEHERFPQDYYREAQNWSRKARQIACDS
eukprot:1927110-Pleurochrysis_carterae.AAC.2